MPARGAPIALNNTGFPDMKTTAGLALALLLALAPVPGARAADGKLAVVAAENFYGDIARQIGGDRVAVVSIMNNPDQDPHLFETTPGIVRQIAGAQIAVLNGANYDPWMEKLLSAAPQPNRKVIIAADLMHRQAGDNPHLWYEPATMPAVAKAIAAAPGTAFTASEPVFGPMAEALGLTMRNERFQLSIMNDTEPSARDVAAFEQDLKDHQVRVMFYNKQASSKVVQHLVALARAANIPVVGVTETAPPDLSYQDWMLGELSDAEKALAGRSS